MLIVHIWHTYEFFVILLKIACTTNSLIFSVYLSLILKVTGNRCNLIGDQLRKNYFSLIKSSDSCSIVNKSESYPPSSLLDLGSEQSSGTEHLQEVSDGLRYVFREKKIQNIMKSCISVPQPVLRKKKMRLPCYLLLFFVLHINSK